MGKITGVTFPKPEEKQAGEKTAAESKEKQAGEKTAAESEEKKPKSGKQG